MRETSRAKQAYADYLAMGPGRSLASLVARYQTDHEAPPTKRLKSLADWSVAFDWQARLTAIAEQEVAVAEAREAAYRKEIMETGYALPHERIRTLKRLATILEDELTSEGEQNRRWVRDVKQIGSGPLAERIDLERFNAAEVDQLRGLLDDIAKEQGERKEQVQHGGEIGIRQLVGVDLAKL